MASLSDRRVIVVPSTCSGVIARCSAQRSPMQFYNDAHASPHSPKITTGAGMHSYSSISLPRFAVLLQDIRRTLLALHTRTRSPALSTRRALRVDRESPTNCPSHRAESTRGGCRCRSSPKAKWRASRPASCACACTTRTIPLTSRKRAPRWWSTYSPTLRSGREVPRPSRRSDGHCRSCFSTWNTYRHSARMGRMGRSD